MLRSSVGAVLELAALDKHDWELALQRILRIDSHVLEVDRASYWDLSSEPRSITCQLGYVDSADALERGAVLTDVEAHTYLDELAHSEVIDVTDVDHDPRTAELHQYCESRHIRSMLDVPVWVESRLVGVVCHEHVGAPRRWTSAEIDFALFVAQVIATGLEARARSRAEEQERQASFLAHASMVLSASLDERTVGERAVAAALTGLADWATVDRFDDSRVERIAWAHVDPYKRVLLDAYVLRFPPGADSPHMTVQARRIRQAAVIADVTDEVLRQNGFGDEHTQALRAVGIKSAIAVPFRTASGEDLGMTFISSTRAYDYDTLKLAEAYVERVACALNNAHVYGMAQAALRARDEFLAMAAHELRTPITSLRTSCERLAVLTKEHDQAELEDLGARVLRQSRRLTRLVNRMLDASATAEHQPLVVLQPLDLVPLVRRVVDEAGTTPRGSRVSLSAPPSLVVHADEERLRHVIANLVENALKYGRGEPVSVTLAADDAAHLAVLTVADRGIGIDADALPTLFEPYARGVSSRRYGGLGIGLFVARQIMEAHHGSINVRSEKGVGSVFTLRLPLDGPLTH